MAQEILQYDMFTGEAVDNRTDAQKRQDRQRDIPNQGLLFSAAEIAQFGINAHPLLPINDETRLGLDLLDIRSEEEKDHDRKREAEKLTLQLIPDAPADSQPHDEKRYTPVCIITDPKWMLPAQCGDAVPEPGQVDEDVLWFTTGIVYSFEFSLV